MRLSSNFWGDLFRYDASYPAALLVAIAMYFVLRRARKNLLALPEVEPVADVKPADCMVVIPARNEEAVIARAVKSLPADSVIVVDDASSDKTAEVARAAGAGVLPAPKLGFGAWGKPSACAEGARVLTSKWILFADADTWFEPGFLESAVAAAETQKVDFVSIHLRPEYESTAMRILGPVAKALYYGGFTTGADREEMFHGQCILVRRHSYEFIGGHRAIARFMDEGVKMAALAKRHRMRFAVARAHQLSHAAIQASDFLRAAYGYDGTRFWIGTRVLAGGVCCAPWLPAMAWLIVRHHYVIALVFACLPSALLHIWYGWPQALLAPVGIYAVLPVVLGGAWNALTGRTLHWKGREL